METESKPQVLPPSSKILLVPDFTLDMAKQQYDCSKAKALIYGDTGPKSAPIPHKTKRGTRSVDLQPHEKPFATIGSPPEDIYPVGYTKMKGQVCAPDKIGSSRIFDPDVYIRNRKDNFRNQRDSRMKNFCGSGKILAHEPKSVQQATAVPEPSTQSTKVSQSSCEDNTDTPDYSYHKNEAS